MAGALAYEAEQRRQAMAARQGISGGAKMARPTENKAVTAPPRHPGLALPSSRFSSKGARGLAIEAKLTEDDFKGAPMSGQQDRYTIADVEAVIARKRKAAGQ